MPKDDGVEAVLSKVENLLGKGHFGSALRAIDAIKISETPLAREYEFIRQDKTARANLGIADRYFIRGDGARARKFYQQAIDVATTDPAVKSIAKTAGKVFDTLLQRSTALIQGMQKSIRTNKFDQWCGQKRDLGDSPSSTTRPSAGARLSSNDGVSMVRFQDTGNKRKIDKVHVFAEPDADIAKLCYKRLQRGRHVGTMAFPDSSSFFTKSACASCRIRSATSSRTWAWRARGRSSSCPTSRSICPS